MKKINPIALAVAQDNRGGATIDLARKRQLLRVEQDFAQQELDDLDARRKAVKKRIATLFQQIVGITSVINGR